MATHAAVDFAEPAQVVSPEQGVSAHAASAGFQLRYVVWLGLAVACGAAAAAALIYVLLGREVRGYAQGVTVVSAARQQVLAAVVFSGLVYLIISGTIVAILALFASHKIAGPVVRLVRVMAGVAQGRLPRPVRFRRGDQVGTLEGHFNKVSNSLCQRHEVPKRKLAEVRSAEAQLRRALGDSSAPAERREAGRQLRERAGELASLLAGIGGTAEKDSSG